MPTRKILDLSTEHLPASEPDFGGLRALPFEYGYVVWVADPKFESAPQWIMPIVRYAYDCKCMLILFDADAEVDDRFKTWEW